MRLAVIGRGKWGMNIVRTLATMRDVQLIEESRDLSIILREKPAGVVIATPSTTHAGLALPFLEAGVPTFIEKPMATAVDDAMRIREAALRSGTPVVVGHVQLHNPAFQAAIQLFSRFESVQAVFWEGMSLHPRTDSSVLWDWLPHGLSMAQAIFGASPGFAQAWGVGEPSQFKAAIAHFVIGGVPFIANASWISPLKRHRMTIVGENESLTFDDGAKRKLSLRNPQGTSFPVYDEELPLTRELGNFINVLRAGKLDMAQLENDVAIVRAIATAEESARNAGQLLAIDNSRD